MPEKDVTLLASKIELLLMDVDGVLTAGEILLVPMPDGSVVEAKTFNTKDGAGLALAHRAGLKTGIITGRSSPALTRRAEELKMDFLYEGFSDSKISAIEEIYSQTKLSKEQVCYVGDDLQDLPVINRVGFPVAVADAAAEVAARAAYVTRAAGGHGAIREVVELILRAQHKWEAALRQFTEYFAGPSM
jgi:3-deoxy-D-manno-octulosonate 8-phosphate phosphatase (KDO 8-P phosphatase)